MWLPNSINSAKVNILATVAVAAPHRSSLTEARVLERCGSKISIKERTFSERVTNFSRIDWLLEQLREQPRVNLLMNFTRARLRKVQCSTTGR